MPLAYYNLAQTCEVAIWEITEPDTFFAESLSGQEFPLDSLGQIAHPDKRLQWLGSRYLLCRLYPHAIQKYSGRRPVLTNGPHLSLSHSAQFVAVMLSQKKAGIDIQTFTEKLLRIATKYTSDAELKLTGVANRLQALSLVWSIKEAVFKKYETGLPFHTIQVRWVDLNSERAGVQLKYGDQIFNHSLAIKLFQSLSLAYLVD